MDICKLYLSGKSIPEISEITKIAKSTIRFKLKNIGVLRSRSDALILASKNGKLGGGNRGKRLTFTQEHKDKISKSKTGSGKGFRITKSGYIEFTSGENKGRLEHVLIIENKIGRKLYSNECVHHKNHIKTDNSINNLKLMTRSEHSRLHALENLTKRTRNKKGEFI